jgi:two-component system LytT family response regulator
MLSCYIIDDESHAVELLTDYIGKTPTLKLAGSSLDPIAGLHHILANPPDVLFLDVDMPGLSGLDVFGLAGDQVHIVFTTGFANYAVDAYTVNAADFLLKPVRYERFLQSVKKLETLTVKSKGTPISENNFMFIQVGVKGKLQKIDFDHVTFIESMNNYLDIHTINDHHLVYISLREIMEKLPEDIFFRIHRSFIINYKKVTSIEGNRVFFEKAPAITIGPQYRDAFFKRVQADWVSKK